MDGKSLLNSETTIFPRGSIRLCPLLFSHRPYLTPWLMERAISNTIFYFDTEGALNQMFPNLLSHSYKEKTMLKSDFVEVFVRSFTVKQWETKTESST